MKIALLSFLFCCITGFSQSEKDSISYYRNILLNPEKPGDLTKAYLFFENQIEQNRKQKDTLGFISNLQLLAIAQYNMGFYYESEQAATEALQWAEAQKINSKKTAPYKVGLYNLLGNYYKNRFNYNKALYFYRLAFPFAQTKDSIILLNNTALVYKEQQDYKKAETELIKALKMIAQDTASVTYNRLLDNLGFIQFKLHNPQAITTLQKALQNRIGNNDLIGMFSSYRHLFYYYLENNNKQLAGNSANRCYEIAKQLKSGSYIKEALSLFLLLDENQKVQEYKTVSDSLEREKKVQQNKFAALKYDIDKEKTKTQAYKLKEERQKRLKTLFILGSVLLVIASVFFFFYNRGKFKQKTLQEIYNTEQLLSKKVHDELANGIYQSMVAIQSKDFNKETALESLETVYQKTRNLSKQTGTIATRYFKEELQALLGTFNTSTTKILTKDFDTVKWEYLSEEKKQTVYRVLQELLTNMHKHSGASLVVISFYQENKKITVTYADNGIGWKGKKGNGLTNTENRIKYLNGVITFDVEKTKNSSSSTKGFKVLFTV